MEPIDAVFTWVDGSRPLHRFRRAFHAHTAPDLCADSNLSRRYADHGELRYSLRSLQLNAPWIRNIFIVTDGGKPAWLREDDRLRIISHRLIFENAAHLPTFNSCAIELHLHRIPGLSERFLYVNDDCFFARPTQPADFFDAHGKLLTLFSEYRIPPGAPVADDGAYVCGLKNANLLLDKRFGTSERRQLEHSPRPMLRSICSEFWSDFTEQARHCSSNKFRCRSDIAFNLGIHPYYAWHTGRAFESPLPFHAGCLRDDESENLAILWHLEQTKPTLFCINDDTTKRCAGTWTEMRAMLGRLFPEPSAFER